MLEKSWWFITDSTIKKCFRHARLTRNNVDTPNIEEEADDDLLIAMWIEKHKISSFSMSEKRIKHFSLKTFNFELNKIKIKGDFISTN